MRNVIYLENPEGSFEFFGSPASMYDKYQSEVLGITQKALNNVFYASAKEGKPLIYKTRTGYIIKKGAIQLKETMGRSANHLGAEKQE